MTTYTALINSVTPIISNVNTFSNVKSVSTFTSNNGGKAVFTSNPITYILITYLRFGLATEMIAVFTVLSNTNMGRTSGQLFP